MNGTNATLKESIAFLTDLHVPNHDVQALKVALNYLRDKDLTMIILSELPENESVAFWKHEPKRLKVEIAKNKRMLEVITNNFPNIPDGKKIYIPGNHDERLSNYILSNAAALVGIDEIRWEKLMHFSELGWEYCDNKRRMQAGLGPLTIGKLTILHGHEIKASWGAVNLAKIYYERCKTNVIFGHHHRRQEWDVKTVHNRHEGSWMVGCLCDLHPSYMPHNDWVHGFAYIELYDDGTFHIENKRIIEGRIL